MAFNIFLLLMPFIVVSLIFGVGILFVRKKYRLWWRRFVQREKALDVIMITSNKNLHHGVAKIDNEKFKYKNMEYVIDNEAIYTEKFRIGQRPYSIYIQGNPKPIKFDLDNLKPEISAMDVKKFSESKLISQLLETKEEQLAKYIIILTIFCIAIVGVVGFLLFKKSDTILLILEQIKGVTIR